MSIEAATGLLTLLLLITTTSLGMFVKNKIADSEDRLMTQIAQTYMSRELANEKFGTLNARVDAISNSHTPRRMFPYTGPVDET